MGTATRNRKSELRSPLLSPFPSLAPSLSPSPLSPAVSFGATPVFSNLSYSIRDALYLGTFGRLAGDELEWSVLEA